MKYKIKKDQVQDILAIVLCIASKDGIISQTELTTLKKEFSNIFTLKLTDKQNNQALEDFFSSNDQIEDYLEKIEDHELRIPILRLSLISAASDGFDIKENIGYQKALMIWNLSNEEDVLKREDSSDSE
tara:strand:+ start:8198 stop:8584 length:387 start_codon:yes stop_codon:yes gene_type:complete